MQYVAQDVKTTLDVALACESVGALRWVSRKGKLRTMRLLDGWLSVEEALELPLPYTVVDGRAVESGGVHGVDG